MDKKKYVCVIGWDDFNLNIIRHLEEARECRFFPGITFSEMRKKGPVDIPGLIEIAEDRIKEAGRIDAVVSYYDFPGSLLVPIIAKRHGLTGPSLESVMKCEHKYWGRTEQQKVIPDNIPRFQAFDPFDPEAYEKIGFKPPFWVKPVKSYHSYLAYRINDKKQFWLCMKEVREKIGAIIEPFTHIFEEYNLSPEIGRMKEPMFAETCIRGHQCTAEGYATGNEIKVYSIVDSIRAENGSSLIRYEYPSKLPEKVKQEIRNLSQKVIGQIGLKNSAFNIEYFYNKDDEKIRLLEVNPRISQSHAAIFEKVHGVSHHEVMLNLALNRQPRPLNYQGEFNVAAHFMLRSFRPGVVKQMASEKTIQDLQKKYPDMLLKINVQKGTNLEEMPPYQVDSYSYVLANIFLGGSDREELMAKYRDVEESLAIEISNS
ncbi:MAG: acetyl-CoA carboxylase biotin carboxylase subunit family protein [Bacteroidales bacterium]